MEKYHDLEYIWVYILYFTIFCCFVLGFMEHSCLNTYFNNNTYRNTESEEIEVTETRNERDNTRFWF